MKNLLKSIASSIGYVGLYLLISFLVVIAGAIVFGLQSVRSAQAAYSFDTIYMEIAVSIYKNILLLTFIAGTLTLLSLLIILKIRKKSIVEELGLNFVSLKNLWPVLPLGIILNLFLEYAISLLPISERVMNEYMQASDIFYNDSVIHLIMSTLIMAPLFEEVLFRGLIFKSLQKSMPWYFALFLQALLFGVMHGQIVWISYATIIGIILGLLKLRYRSLFAPILMHFSINASNFIIAPLKDIIGDNILPVSTVFLLSIILLLILGKTIKSKTEPPFELAIEDAPVSVPASYL